MDKGIRKSIRESLRQERETRQRQTHRDQKGGLAMGFYFGMAGMQAGIGLSGGKLPVEGLNNVLLAGGAIMVTYGLMLLVHWAVLKACLYIERKLDGVE
jgi:hypothetical protein